MIYRENATIQDNVLVVGFGPHVVGMDLRTGERVWTHEMVGGMGAASVRVVVERDRVYARFSGMGTAPVALAVPDNAVQGNRTR